MIGTHQTARWKAHCLGLVVVAALAVAPAAQAPLAGTPPAMFPLYHSHPLARHERDAPGAFFAAIEKPGGAANVPAPLLAGQASAPGAATSEAAASTPKAPAPPPLSPAQLAELATQGEQLFSGRVRFQNQGPQCIACHSVGSIGFPNGGTMGPDLTDSYSRLGAQGVAAALSTLYFPAMMPLYVSHPLTPAEQSALGAFLQRADHSQPPHPTPAVLGIGIVIFLIVLAITGILGRQRLTGVRRRLMEAARQAPRRAEILAELAPARPVAGSSTEDQ